ncbi:transcription-repair coupling factor [Salisediminibacterium beveridgei]|uniref:transcription-repair coupling factor n=1 Tax=Salisediminibacterium beveridgei TaxID=632773 RepID=UPI000ACA2529
MKGLLNSLMATDELEQVIKGIEQRTGDQSLIGVSGSARAMHLAAMFRRTGRSQLVVTHNLFQAQKLYDDLITVLTTDEVLLYPANELISSEIAVASPEMRGQRLEVLNEWSAGEKRIVIAPVAGVRRLLTPPKRWYEEQLAFATGEDVDFDTVLEQFVHMGYTRAQMVSSPGEFSVRGGIIDIYPLTEEHPVRIELFDTEVDSIRLFDVETQLSVEEMPNVIVGPAREILVTEEELVQGADKLEGKLAASLKRLKDEQIQEAMVQNIGEEIDRLRNGQFFDAIYKYMRLLFDAPATLVDYTPEDCLIVLDEWNRVQETAQTLEQEEADWMTTMIAQGAMVHDLPVSEVIEDLMTQATQQKLYTMLFGRQLPQVAPDHTFTIQTKSMQQFHGQIHLLKNEVTRWKEAGYAIVFVSSDGERASRLNRVLDDYEIEAAFIDSDGEPVKGKAVIIQGMLHSGFELPMHRLVVIAEEDVFTKKSRKPKRRQKLSNAERIKNYSELKVGDWVVHVNHGIGKYLGIETLQVGPVHKDYMHISYAGNDKLYVPVDQIDQVQKYVASEDKDPKLYSLGGSEWKKVKKKVQASVQNIADDLIKLYAKRQNSRGFAFSPDGLEQREFESTFPYQETEDQLQAIEEIKNNMEQDQPMDRLLCGDVGYGKTEVALRAAFKAIMDGKQVAILVPTTILAQQHYETIRERFQDFAITFGLMSRFRTRKQLKETTEALQRGTCDIVVGTHRVLSKDVKFKDLGLLVVDEEQRFGVTHKEKIKQLKANVDVLTLTATPIPRTLHMSMLGVRDLSVIETPPENRFPVQTYVVEHNDAFVREAIERELAREGQVFYLYNRVEDIEMVADRIAMMVPDANVAFAHGQMSEGQLEAVMLDFLEGETDVLVTTTIIETGVDIPNVNTLIIQEADRMGLSQLYQLRGRVGRSNRVAYAYFTHQRDKVLTEVAERRLQSIKEFTELGSGFKIAMRDLSIRGAGNLLGAEQHGFIASVGFDLYSKMLKEAIDERKDEIDGTVEHIETKDAQPDIDLEIQVDAYIPESYIGDSKQKIDMYKKFKGVQSFADVEEVQVELIDRFGEYPTEVELLISVAKIKLYARQEEVVSIAEKNNECKVVLSEERAGAIDGARLFTLVNQLSKHMSLSSDGKGITIHIRTKSLDDSTFLHLLEQVLSRLDEVEKSPVTHG